MSKRNHPWRGLAATLSLAAACSSDAPPGSSSTNILNPPPPVTGTGGAAPGVTGATPMGGGAIAPTGGAMATAGTPAAGTAGGAPTGGTSGAMASAGAGAGGGSAPVGSPDWTMIGYDASSTYFNAGETVLTKDNAANLAEIWTADFGGNVYGAPLQIGDKIYASGPGSVRAFDAATGNMQWQASVSSSASLAYADGTLYANAAGGQVVAIDAANGQMKWSKQPNTQRADGSSSPVVAGDVVLIGGSNGGAELSTGQFRGYLAALDRMTGDVKWVTQTVPSGANGASIWSSASADVAAGRAYGSTGNNYGEPATDTSDAIIAFELGTGTIVWKNQRVEGDTFIGFGSGKPDHDFGANPVLYETMVDGVLTKVVSAGAKSGAAHAVKRDDGTLLWTRELCGPGMADGSVGIFVNSTWGGKNMLFACNQGGGATLFALDGATGDVAWMRQLPGQVWGRMSAVPGVGFVGTGNKLEVFDLDTGAVIKSFTSKGGTVAGTITIANGRVAFGEGLSWSSGVRGTTLTVLGVR